MLARLTIAMLLAISARAQFNDSRLAGVELRLGMSRETVLASFAQNEQVKLSNWGVNGYFVMVKGIGGLWSPGGSVTFESNKLTRIAIDYLNSDGKNAGALARAIYTAAAAGETSGSVEIWTGRNDDANNPLYEVHLVFKDREVVISTHSVDGSDIVSVTAYFPRVLTHAKQAK